MKKYLVIRYLENIKAYHVKAAFDTYEDADTYAKLSNKARECDSVKYMVFEQSL